MAKQGKAKKELRGKTRMRAEIVEAVRGLHKVGAIGNDELQKTTMKMLGRKRCRKSRRCRRRRSSACVSRPA